MNYFSLRKALICDKKKVEMLISIWCTFTDCIYCFNHKLLLPRISRFMALAILSMPSFPNICSWWPHLGQTYTLMFWTRPSTGTSTLRNISAPFLASNRAMSCGVDTMTAPEKKINARFEHNSMGCMDTFIYIYRNKIGFSTNILKSTHAISVKFSG